MKYKTKDQAIKYLIKKYARRKGNLVLSQKLFVANAILEWIYDKTDNPQVLKVYIDDLEKYIQGKIELEWTNGKQRQERTKKC